MIFASFFRRSVAPAVLTLTAVLAATILTGCTPIDNLKNLTEVKTQKTVITTVPPEMQTDANSVTPAISADGRFIAFQSDATNLVIGPTTGVSGIYLKDAQSGRTIRISSNSEGVQGNRDSVEPDISGDGKLVVFSSSSTNLIVNDNNNQCSLASGINVNCPDIFLKDSETGITTLVSSNANSEQGNKDSSDPVISGDGRFVAFKSNATNLVNNDGNGKADIFIKDLRSRSVQRISAVEGTDSDGESAHAAISADGRFVAFESSSTNLVPGDDNGKADVFLKDRQTGAISRVSTGAGGEQGNDASGNTAVAISGDGRFVAFESAATNLVPGDSNAKLDIFVKDTSNGSIARASTGASGSEGSQDSYDSLSISANGRWVAFRSDAPDLVPDDTNTRPDAFFKDMQTGTVRRVSTDAAGAQAKSDSLAVALSADGRKVVFESSANNLITGDTNNKKDIFLKDLQTGAVTRVSTSTADV